jgi:hypothetical protein
MYKLRCLMNRDVNILYPALSSLAKGHQTDLNTLAKKSVNNHDNYIGLADCCHYVFNNRPRRSNIDCINYLTTLNEYIQHIDPAKKDFIWNQLTKGDKSTFLDTLVEASWYLHFTNNGFKVATPVPFYNNEFQSGDADLVVTRETTEWWLDVYSLGSEKSIFPTNNSSPVIASSKSLDDVILEIGRKAIKKFHNKFPSHVRTGKTRLGLLICIMKREATLLRPLMRAHQNGLAVHPPPNLFSKNQNGLHIIIVNTLGTLSRSEILQPIVYCTWKREQHNNI